MKKINLLFIMLFLSTFSFANEKGIDEKINDYFAPIADKWEAFVLTSIPLFGKDIPIILIILIGSATFFTLYFKFANIRLFPVAIKTVQGKYDEIDHHAIEQIGNDADGQILVDGDLKDTIRDESKEGELSHFQALTAAVSGTVGLGNIAGVAVAISLGGPGATFWMIIAGLLGMSSKLVECTLGVKYREIDADGTVYGGPMYYLKKGLAKINLPILGKILSILFAVLCIGASFGGGNAFQSNQAVQQIISQFGIDFNGAKATLGIIIAFSVGLVIIGGIKRIGNVTEKLVPFMAGIYIIACLIVIGFHFSNLPHIISLIFTEAFAPSAMYGGTIGVILQGFRRAAFSNEAGVGSAAIAHSAVKTKFPASEGIVSLLEPFIDTVVICTMTAIVIVITGDYQNSSLSGVAMTSQSFDTVIPHFSYVLTIAIVLFAISTMLSWSYYGLQAWKFLFGRSKISDITYKVLFLIFIVIGASATLDAVIQFSDAMILAMVLPNMIGLVLLAPKVKEEIARFIQLIKK